MQFCKSLYIFTRNFFALNLENQTFTIRIEFSDIKVNHFVLTYKVIYILKNRNVIIADFCNLAENSESGGGGCCCFAFCFKLAP